MNITDITGQTEMLTDYRIEERVKRVNGDISLSFFVPKTENNAHAFDLVQEESVVEYDGQEYRIKSMEERTINGTPVKRIDSAPHVFFDIIDKHQYDTLSGSINATRALNHIFDVTDWTWVNHGAFNSVEFENFGDDTALALFVTFLSRYGAEFEITGPREVTLKNQIGELKEEQFRYQYNIKTLSRNVNTENLSTYIKGYGKKTTDEEGNVLSEITAEYTSPNASIYGLRDAPPVRDERFTSEPTLEEHLQKVIKDTPDVSIEIEVVHLGMDVNIGDRIYLIYEPLNLDLVVRVMEYVDYPESFKSPVVTLSSVMQAATDRMVSIEQVKKNVKQLTDADGNLSLKLKRLYSDTNIYHDNTGSWYFSPEDANRFVHIGSGGIDVHRGLIRVERDDGYPIIIGGKLQNEFAIQPTSPPFTSGNVNTINRYWNTTSTTPQECNAFFYRHDGRYLKVRVVLYAEDELTGSRISINEIGGGGALLAQTTTYQTDQQFATDNPVTLTIDLGVPTGQQRGFYLKLNTTENGRGYGRLLKAWLEG